MAAVNQDPLYHWKKHSGFKKGLLTDIVLGDEHIVPRSHYVTTMNSDFGTKQLESGGKIAGRSSGFVISDKGQKHIMFGDEKLIDGDRQETITKNTFKAPPTIQKGMEKSIKL